MLTDTKAEKTRENKNIKFFFLVYSLSKSDPQCIFKIPMLRISIDLSMTQVKAKHPYTPLIFLNCSTGENNLETIMSVFAEI